MPNNSDNEWIKLSVRTEATIEAIIAAIAGLVFTLLGWGTWVEGIIWIAFAGVGIYCTRVSAMLVSKLKIDHVMLVAVVTFVFMGAGAGIDAAHGTTGAVWIWTRIGFALAVMFAIAGYEMYVWDRILTALFFVISAGAGAGIGAIVGGIAGAAGAGDPATLASQWAPLGAAIGGHVFPVFLMLSRKEAVFIFPVMAIGAIIGGVCIGPAGGALGGVVLGYYYGTTVALAAFLVWLAIRYYKKEFPETGGW